MYRGVKGGQPLIIDNKGLDLGLGGVLVARIVEAYDNAPVQPDKAGRERTR